MLSKTIIVLLGCYLNGALLRYYRAAGALALTDLTGDSYAKLHHWASQTYQISDMCRFSGMALFYGFVKLSNNLLNSAHTYVYKTTFTSSYKNLSLLTSYSYKNSLEYLAASRYDADQFLLGRSFRGVYAPLSVIKKNPHITPLGMDHVSFSYKKNIYLSNCPLSWIDPAATYFNNGYQALSNTALSNVGMSDVVYNKVSAKARNFRGRRFFRLYETTSRRSFIGRSELLRFKQSAYLDFQSKLQNFSQPTMLVRRLKLDQSGIYKYTGFFQNRFLIKQSRFTKQPIGTPISYKSLGMLQAGWLARKGTKRSTLPSVPASTKRTLKRGWFKSSESTQVVRPDLKYKTYKAFSRLYKKIQNRKKLGLPTKPFGWALRAGLTFKGFRRNMDETTLFAGRFFRQTKDPIPLNIDSRFLKGSEVYEGLRCMKPIFFTKRKFRKIYPGYMLPAKRFTRVNPLKLNFIKPTVVGQRRRLLIRRVFA